MGRSPCCSKEGLKRGPWSTKEDALLSNYILLNGEGQWRSLPTKAGLLRCGKSCRLRWMNYLRPGIKRGNISPDEEDLIVRLHGLLGNRWSLIAGRLPGRTDNEIKNYWNTHLLKKLSNTDNPKPISPAGAAQNKKKKKKKTKEEETASVSAAEKTGNGAVQIEEEEEEEKGGKTPPMTKVYSPTPIRVSPAFSSRASTSSYDSSSSTDKAASAAAAPEVASYQWPPLPLFGGFCGGEDDFLGSAGSILPLLQHQLDSIAGDDMLLDRVYDEYLQLL